jgi:DNA-binding PucR family transcriptional regulator
MGATPAGLGSVVEPADGARSHGHARAALRLAHDGLVAADEHRIELLLGADPALVAELASARLAPLDAETDSSRARLTETLHAWLRHQGNATAAADDLDVHAQTVRYRLGRLRELFGDTLDDPDARYELETVLRATDSAATA